MKTVMVVFGTRPEAIKMCPLINELKKSNSLKTVVCVTGQHRQMLDMVLNVFNIKPDYDLSIMKAKQTLYDVTSDVLKMMKNVLEEVNPDVVLVHGDTTTTFSTALACFYKKIPVGHVEAGLRTNDIYSPFPEEFNRQAVGLIAKYHFAPTNVAKENLLKEGKLKEYIWVTGNTGIDALKTTVSDIYEHELFEWLGDSKLIILTAHRRENLGNNLFNMFNAINRIVKEFPEVKVIYPVHLNPIVQEIARKVFKDNKRIKLVDPMNVIDFHNFIARSYLILTDSGGIQEEAPSLGKPVLVMRDTTERPEGVKAGTLKLVGTSEDNIYYNFKELLTNNKEYQKMCEAKNPYGDGFASKRIVDILTEIV